VTNRAVQNCTTNTVTGGVFLAKSREALAVGISARFRDAKGAGPAHVEIGIASDEN
jgi:hypothetical protein